MHIMSKDTGRLIYGKEALQQRIETILLTPVGTRLMNREFGSRLMSLIDRSETNNLKIMVYAEIASCLKRWLPDFKLINLSMIGNIQSLIIIEITGKYNENNEFVRLRLDR